MFFFFLGGNFFYTEQKSRFLSVNYILFNENTYKTLHSDIHRKGLENKCKTLIQIPLPKLQSDSLCFACFGSILFIWRQMFFSEHTKGEWSNHPLLKDKLNIHTKNAKNELNKILVVFLFVCLFLFFL